MRCPECNKFVSFDPQAETPDVNFDVDRVTGSVRLTLQCGECGTDLKEAVADFDETIEHECPKLPEDGKPEFEEDSADAEPTERTEETDAKGAAIPKSKQRHLYGADINIGCKCVHCDEVIPVSCTVEVDAGEFEECC